MTRIPLDFKGWHTATLHVVGEHTLYRGSSSVTIPQVAQQVAQLEEHLDACPDNLSSPEAWHNLQAFWHSCSRSGPQPRTNINGISDFLSACDYARDMYHTEQRLRALQIEGLVRQGSSGWVLTPTGIATSVAARDWCSPKNITAFWIERVIDQSYFQKLVTHLKYACARSAQFNEIHDLVHGYLLSLINRNGLRTRIAAGNQPSPSNIRTWVYKSALSQFRNEGRDALTRSFKGARTEKDLRLGEPDDISGRSLPSEMQAIFLGVDGEGKEDVHVSGTSSSNALLDVVGGNLEEEIIHRLTAQRGLALAEAAIRREKSGAQERFLRINQMALKDFSFADIGQVEGVSRNRAAVLVADLRAAVRKATLFSSYAVHALEYIREEPCSTLADIREGLTEQAHLDPETIAGVNQSVLDALVRAGRLRRVGDGGFLLTPTGEAALDNREHFGVEISRNMLG